MNQDSLRELLVCPLTLAKLSGAEERLVAELNRRIESGTAVNRGGFGVSERIEGGLVTPDGRWLYPVRGGIPILIADEAIAVPAAS